jgi:uncharacterized protein YegL
MNTNNPQPEPNTNPAGTTRIVLVLDRSGSMGRVREQARDAFNEAVDRVRTETAKGSGDVTLSLVVFNHEVRSILVNEPARRVRKLGPDDYVPNGSTALFDAVGRGIDLLERPGNLAAQDGALVIVISDGMENASQHVSQTDLVERMQRLEATEQWTFSFMCANVDIRDLTQNLRVPHANVAAWDQTAQGTARMAENLAEGVSNYMYDRRAGVRSKKDFWEKETSESN